MHTVGEPGTITPVAVNGPPIGGTIPVTLTLSLVRTAGEQPAGFNAINAPFNVSVAPSTRIEAAGLWSLIPASVTLIENSPFGLVNVPENGLPLMPLVPLMPLQT